MSYKKADNILPAELLSSIQEYVDGVYIYIPRKENNKKSWGERTGSKEITFQRNLALLKLNHHSQSNIAANKQNIPIANKKRILISFSPLLLL
jgi:hypothetical protein